MAAPQAVASPPTWPNTTTWERGGTRELHSQSAPLCFHFKQGCSSTFSYIVFLRKSYFGKKRRLLLKNSEMTVWSLFLKVGSLCSHSFHKYVLSIYSLHLCSASVSVAEVLWCQGDQASKSSPQLPVLETNALLYPAPHPPNYKGDRSQSMSCDLDAA